MRPYLPSHVPPARATRRRRPAARCSGRRSEVELHLGRRLGFGRRGEQLHRLRAGMDRLGPDHIGEGPQGGVVVPHGLIVVAAGDGDPVFRPLQLRLQGQEVLVGLELGIGFDRDQKARQSAGKLPLGLLVLLKTLVELVKGFTASSLRKECDPGC